MFVLDITVIQIAPYGHPTDHETGGMSANNLVWVEVRPGQGINDHL